MPVYLMSRSVSPLKTDNAESKNWRLAMQKARRRETGKRKCLIAASQVEIDQASKTLSLTREVDGGLEKLRLKLPAVVT